ncbi:MAG: non-homologous end-joining DNA ligase [Gammaproteobacteria bacterium]|nr:non-homologous end-joining DNA ligase [Gammaproteobacteria bacterium]MDH5801471.1 non-homologous end-joining DNA ligase [Gammaproteobacteria bacterium]
MLDPIEPMLAQARAEAFDDDRYLFEIKWDGTRALCYTGNGDKTWRIRNRRGIWIETRYPELAELATLPADTIIDGEIVVLDNGQPSFPKLQQRDGLSDPLRIELLSQSMPVTFVAFDILALQGRDLRATPLQQRREQLKTLLQAHEFKHVLHSEYIIGKGIPYFAQIEKVQWEGVMAKRLNSTYQAGKRSDDWLKIKVSHMDDFWIMGYSQRDNKEPFVSALAVGTEENGQWRYFAKVGSGFNEAQRAALFEHLGQIPAHNYHLRDVPAEIRWIEPRLRARIKYLEITQDQRLRSPVFECFVND